MLKVTLKTHLAIWHALTEEECGIKRKPMGNRSDTAGGEVSVEQDNRMHEFLYLSPDIIQYWQFYKQPPLIHVYQNLPEPLLFTFSVTCMLDISHFTPLSSSFPFLFSLFTPRENCRSEKHIFIFRHTLNIGF